MKTLVTAHPQCIGFRGAGWARDPAFLTSSQGTVGEPLDRRQEEWETRGLKPRLLPGPRLLSHELVTGAKLSSSPSLSFPISKTRERTRLPEC